MSGRARLLKELKTIQESLRRQDTNQEESDVTKQSTTYHGIRDLWPNENNLYEWYATLEGPEETPYAGGRFVVKLSLPSTYPIEPPKGNFMTIIFHPNVHFKTGEICLDILKNEWSPAWTLLSVCQAILVMMSDPAADSPLNCDAGNLLRAGDERGFHGVARMYTIEYASGGGG